MHTNKAEIIAVEQRINTQIMPFFNGDLDALLSFKMRCGCAYLQNYMPHCPELIDELIETAIFWQWWRLEWLVRDECFLQQAAAHGPMHPDMLIAAYKQWHKPSDLATKLAICSEVFENSSICKK